MNIEISLLNEEGELLAKRTSSDFEGAEEDLGKLESWYLGQEQKLADQIKYGEVEEI